MPPGQHGVGSRTQMPQDIRFNHMLFHQPVVTQTGRKCKVHLQGVDTNCECGTCHASVSMYPAPFFERYHTLCEYHFPGPSRDGPKKLKDANVRLGWPTAKEIQMKKSSTLFTISSEMTLIFDAFKCVSFVHVCIVVVELVQLLILYSSYRIFQNEIKLAKHVLKCSSVLKFLN